VTEKLGIIRSFEKSLDGIKDDEERRDTGLENRKAREGEASGSTREKKPEQVPDIHTRPWGERPAQYGPPTTI